MTPSRFVWWWFHPHRIEWAKAYNNVRQAEHRMVAKLTILCHLGYYSLVSVEAHGTYRFMAGGLAVLVVWESIGEGRKAEH